MSLAKVLKVRYLAALALILILTATAFAFAASNTVPESSAGDGQNKISGYTIADVTYALDDTNPANIASVRFSVTPTSGKLPPATVKAQLVQDGKWFSCSLSDQAWSCKVTDVTALAADQLRVVAAQ